jgi:hypothetical protein
MLNFCNRINKSVSQAEDLAIAQSCSSISLDEAVIRPPSNLDPRIELETEFRGTKLVEKIKYVSDYTRF